MNHPDTAAIVKYVTYRPEAIEVLRLARDEVARYISDPRDAFNHGRFICWALYYADCDLQVRLDLRSYVANALHPYRTLESWLGRKHVMQHRLEWIDAMIKTLEETQ